MRRIYTILLFMFSLHYLAFSQITVAGTGCLPGPCSSVNPVDDAYTMSGTDGTGRNVHNSSSNTVIIQFNTGTNQWEIKDCLSTVYYTNANPTNPNPPATGWSAGLGACAASPAPTLSGDVVAGCTDPDVPSVSFNPATICDGNSALLSWTGSLGDATNWHVYSGSCGGGGTLEGITTSTSLVVTPSSPSTEYFVRGEGGCVAAGTCGSVVVPVTATEDATFSYSSASYSPNGADPSPTITGVGGGTFTSSPPGGLVIDLSTGIIDLGSSTLGTYTITYTTPGLCAGSEDQIVAIADPVVAIAAAGCNTYSSAVSGSSWVEIVDGSGAVVASINPNGVDLGIVSIEMDDRASVGQDNQGLHYIPRFFNFESTNFDGVGSAFPSAVWLRLYYKEAELTDYNTAAGTTLAIGDLVMSHYSGTNEDCDITNNQHHTIATVTDIIPSAFLYNGTDFYLEFNVPHFSEIGAGAGGLMLPVELNSFSGRALDNANELVWNTASESDFSHYEIQRSLDGVDFRAISEVEGKGNTAEVSNYSYIDRDVTGTKNYYRLKMIDLDETFEYSSIILLESASKGGISTYPNPAKETVQVQLNATLNDNVFYTISSINGKRIMEGKMNDQNQDLDISPLAAGIYILNVNGNGINETIKLVKEE